MEQKSRIWNVAIYLFVFAAIQVFAGITGGAVAEFQRIGGASNDGVGMPTEIIVWSSLASNMIIGLTFVMLKWCPLSKAFFRKNALMVGLWSILIALATLLPTAVFEEILPKEMQEDLLADTIRNIVGNPLGYLVLGIMAPIVEEIVFRGAIQREAQTFFADRGYSHWWAIAVASLLFALIHMNPIQMPHAFIIGMLLGWLYKRSGSVIPGILVHWVNNTVAYLIYANVKGAEVMHSADYFGGEKWRVLLAVAMSVALFVVAVIQLRASFSDNIAR